MQGIQCVRLPCEEPNRELTPGSSRPSVGSPHPHRSSRRAGCGDRTGCDTTIPHDSHGLVVIICLPLPTTNAHGLHLRVCVGVAEPRLRPHRRHLLLYQHGKQRVTVRLVERLRAAR
eukprot:scaffold23849_cov42-Phaeocystis_antarctica.AAC.1